MEINTRINLLRLLRGLTQEELAFQVEVPRASLGHYEIGSYVPRDNILMHIAAILSVEPGYLRYGSPVVRNQVWITSIPKHPQSKRNKNIYEDIEKLFPEFILENAFTSVVMGKLADGNRTLLFGKNKNFDCLLLTHPDLADKLIATLNDLEQHKIADNPFGAVKFFDQDCILFILNEIKSFGFSIDFNQMIQTLFRVTSIKTRSINDLDAVAMEHAAKNDNDLRDQLLRIASAISIDLTGGVTLEQLVEEQGKYSSYLNVSSYSDQLSKHLCVLLRAACNLLVNERRNL